MGLFDFLKPKPAEPSLAAQEALRTALASLIERRNGQTVAAFDQALSAAMLLLGVREVPSSISSGANVIEEDTDVAILESATPSGDRVLFAFTNPDEVHARNPDVGIIGRPSRDVLQMVIDDEYDLLAIDPAGRVLELSRSDVARILAKM
ncbi:MAG TPA: SseB family protein [Gemmatimonadaceae bacterium]|nr:SseB family protein [Gemmatimonadaceae bacterium]